MEGFFRPGLGPSSDKQPAPASQSLRLAFHLASTGLTFSARAPPRQKCSEPQIRGCGRGRRAPARVPTVPPRPTAPSRRRDPDRARRARRFSRSGSAFSSPGIVTVAEQASAHGRHRTQKPGRILGVEHADDEVERAVASSHGERPAPEPRPPPGCGRRRATARHRPAPARSAAPASDAAAAPANRYGGGRRRSPRATWSKPARVFEAGDRRRGVEDLVRAEKRRARQVEPPARALVAHPGFGLGETPFPAGAEQRRADRGGAGVDHRHGLVRLRRDHAGRAGFEDAGLLEGDLGDRVAEKGDVVDRDRGDRR